MMILRAHVIKTGVRLLLVLVLSWVSTDRTSVALGQAPGAVRWKFTPETPGNWSGPSIGPDGTVYVSLCESNGNGVVYALEGATGNVKWQFRSTCFRSTPSVGDNALVYVGGGDHNVYALGVADGSVQWSYSSGQYAFEASPAIGPTGLIYIGCDDNNLYALDATNGQKRWTFTSSGQIHEAPAVGIDGTVYTGSADGRLYALNGSTGIKKWAFATGGAITCSPAIGADGTVYFGSADHNVYAVNGATGVKRWAYATAAVVDWSPAIADDMVVIGSKDGVMYSLDVDNGGPCWSLPFGSPFSRAHPTYGTDGNLYFGGPGWFTALDHITKNPAWYISTPTTNNLTTVLGPDGTAYFGSDGGIFYAIWSSTLGGFGQSPWPAAGQNVRHTGLQPSGPKILNQPASQTVKIGGASTLASVVVGTPPLSFRWVFNGKPIGAATNTALALTNLQGSMLGGYALVITNYSGSVTSDLATLSLSQPPAITLQPQAQTIPLGGSAKFSVAATSAAPESYQWQQNMTNLAGAVQPDLLISNVTPANGGLYRAVVSNMVGFATSSNATLVVVMPAALAIHPNGELNLSGTVGGTYRLESTFDLANPSWVPWTNMTLSSPAALVPNALPNQGKTFYRAVTTQ